MSLVAYGSSDESDEDDTTAQIVANVTVVKKSQTDSILNHNSKVIYCEKSSDVSENNSNVINVSSDSVNGHYFDSKSTSGVTANISDEEEEDVSLDKPCSSSSSSSSSINVSELKETNNKTLLSLPAPKTTKLHDIDFDWNRLSKGIKGITQPIKISVPSLSDLDSDESAEPVKKKLKPSKKGSGLFALLPSPKNSFINPTKTSLKPQQLKNKTQQQGKLLNNSKVTSTKNKLPLSLSYDDSPDEDEGNDDGKAVDFFSLSSSKDDPISEVHAADIDLISVQDKQVEIKIPPQNSVKDLHNTRHPAGESSSSFVSSVTSTSNTYGSTAEELTAESASFIPLYNEEIKLDETALQQLCGRRDRHKSATSLQVVDISGDAIMPDAREWMTKQLTEEKNTNIQSHKKKDGPTTQQRRKHQITYLAFQAKEHELELKNQWANNRMSRKQTQAKYGF